MRTGWGAGTRSNVSRRLVTSAALIVVGVGILAFVPAALIGQVSRSERVLITRADTLNGPSGCAASAAIVAIQSWFDAVTRGDTSEANRAFAPEMRWFSITASDPDSPNPGGRTQFAAYDRVALYSYVKAAAGRRASLQLLSVEFNGWRGRELEMGASENAELVNGGGRLLGTDSRRGARRSDRLAVE